MMVQFHKATIYKSIMIDDDNNFWVKISIDGFSYLKILLQDTDLKISTSPLLTPLQSPPLPELELSDSLKCDGIGLIVYK